MDGALSAAGTSAAAIGFDKLGAAGVLYRGLEVMGGDAILTGLVLGAVGVFVIERQFVNAAAFAAAGAVLSYFGFMHGEAVGIGGGLGVMPSVAFAYAVVAILPLAIGRASYSSPASKPGRAEGALAVPAE
jgi:AGZA family xanthine/uracil permease-like MFS transporter